MYGAIFHVEGGGQLSEMREEEYDSEDVLQKLLADYPNLLAGDQIDPGEPRRWILVAREIGIPGEDNAHDRWALDHLFLDQDAVPTLVEVKRSSDTRIRREVVGQMLDYAANAVAYWPVERVQMAFEKSCHDRGADHQSVLAQLLGTDAPIGSFWQKVATNLNAGKVRLVFVADEIPRELKQIVEFLNGQMSPAEVIAVEIKQFKGESGQVLVPRVIGLTAEADAKKLKAPSKAWDEATYFAALSQAVSDSEVRAARGVLEWIASRSDLSPVWGTGATRGGLGVRSTIRDKDWVPARIWSSGSVEIPFTKIRSAPFDTVVAREEFRTQLNRIPGVSIPPDKIGGYATFPLASLTDQVAREAFIQALDWFFRRVKGDPPG